MANLILTQNCNKNCSYCFANQFRNDMTMLNEMSLETVSSILDKILIDNTSNVSRVSLLGGEPTSHSQFETILNLCFARNMSVLLISNFLFSSDIRDILIKAIKSKRKIDFLANATELRISNRLQTFSENYNAIYKTINEQQLDISCGFTFAGELLTVKGFDDYLNFISERLIAIDKVRLSLNFPSSPKDLYFLNNQELGDLVYYAVRRSLYAGASPNIDCITFPCMYKTKKMRDFIRKYDGTENDKYICMGAPEDYLPDGTVRYCFPAFSIFVDGTKYQTDTGIKSALRNKYNLLQLTAKIPEACKQCQFFKDKLCVGPCLGMLDL